MSTGLNGIIVLGRVDSFVRSSFAALIEVFTEPPGSLAVCNDGHPIVITNGGQVGTWLLGIDSERGIKRGDIWERFELVKQSPDFAQSLSRKSQEN